MNAEDDVPFGCEESLTDDMKYALNQSGKTHPNMSALNREVERIKAESRQAREEDRIEEDTLPEVIDEDFAKHLHDTIRQRKALEKREKALKTHLLSKAKKGDIGETIKYGSYIIKIKEKAGRLTTNWAGFLDWVEDELSVEAVESVMIGYEKRGKPTKSIEVDLLGEE